MKYMVYDLKSLYCTHCGGRLRRVINMPVIHFKGTGFYSTDGEDK